MPFQRGGVAYATASLGRHQSAIIADEMGLGKTIQSLCVANEIGAKTVTVGCPASLRLNWRREAEKWLTSAKATVYSYDELRIRESNFDVPPRSDLVILDECHYLKTPGKQRTVAALALEAENRLFLSGTPIKSRPIELYPILNSISPGEWMTYHEYGLQYCAGFQEVVQAFNPKTKKRHKLLQWNYKGASNLLELQRRLRSTIMVRRLKSAVLKDLPPKVRQIIVLPGEYKNASGNLLEAVRKLWGGRVESHSAEAVGGLSVTKIALQDRLAKLRHEQALAKVPVVVSHARDVLESVDKIIIFAHHRDVIDQLTLEMREFHPVRVIGGMPDNAKDFAERTFQNDPDCHIFIGQHEAAGVGLNLTAANAVLFAELPWTPGEVSQCEDRAHRIGQKGSVLVQHIVLNGSIDALISKILVRKQKILDSMLDGIAPEISFDILSELATIDPGDNHDA